MIDKYISDDKKQITLPVPLGQTIYMIYISCGDFCRRQRTIFRKAQEKYPEELGCFHSSACKTKEWSVIPTKMELSNIEVVLDEWNTKFFETEEKAEKEAQRQVEENRERIKKFGMSIQDNGYSVRE